MTRAEPLPAEPPATVEVSEPHADESLLREYAAPTALGILMLVLGLFHLGHKSFWIDETYTWSSASLNNAKFVHHLLSTEAEGGIYLVFQHVWVQFGSSAWWLRLPSVMFATATVPAMWVLTRRLCDSRTATLATALLVLNANIVDHAQEARTYALVVLLACISMYWFAREMENPSRRTRNWWVLTTVLLVFAHVVAALVIAAQLVSLFVARPDGERRRHVLFGGVATAVLAAPFLLFVRSQPFKDPVSHPSVGDLYGAIRDLAGGGRPLLALEGLAACAGLALLVMAFRAYGWSDEVWRRALPALWFSLCGGMLFIYSEVAPGFQSRYMLAFLPGLLILVATGIMWIPNRVLRVVAIVLVLALGAHSVWDLYGQPRDGWRTIGNVLVQDRKPGDVVVFDVDFSRVPVAYYLRDEPATRADITPLWPGSKDWESGFHTGDYQFVATPPAVMAKIAAEHDRIWVVEAGVLRSKTRAPLKALERTHRRVFDVQVDGPASLQLYERR